MGCKKDLINELPSEITKLQPVANLSDSLKYIFTENGNAITRNPALFADTVQKNIILTKASKVYVTFIDENTDKQNSLFWYSYPMLQPPANTSDVKGHILFPNVSKVGEGGLLQTGYTLELGTDVFPAGTVIGFYIIAGGWDNGKINYSRNTIYTNYNLNVGGEQLHVLFKNAFSRYLVVGFEDNLNGQHDFNDVLFAVSDNDQGLESSSFDLNKVYYR